jgi:hypothetical protein
MKLPGPIGKIASVILLLSLSPVMLAQKVQTALKPPDFSATELIQAAGRPLPPMKIYRSGSNLRVERGPGFVNIYLLESDEAYELLDRAHACIKMTADQRVDMFPSPLQLLFGAKVERTPAGTEVIDGHTCTVETVVVTTAKGKTFRSKVWEAEDLKGIPVKFEAQTEHGSLNATFRDIVVGTPDAALFTPPSNRKCVPFEQMYTVAK